eukprot:sb/3461778/
MTDVKAPILKDGGNYEIYKKEVEMWKLATSTDKKKQAPKLIMALEGKARQIGMNIATENIAADGGVDFLIQELEKVFAEDETQSLFEAVERFEMFRRGNSQKIGDFLSEFCSKLDDLQRRLKSETLYSSEILAYRVLSQANLSSEQRRLLRATCGQLTFKNMCSQMKKAYGEGVPVPEDLSDKEIKEEIFYTNSNGQGRGQNSTAPVCSYCNKIGHTYRQCWQRENHQYHAGHYQNRKKPGYGTQDILQMDELTLVDEVGPRAVLDTGAAATVCGEQWLTLFEEVISQRLTRRNCFKRFKFGAGEPVKSKFSVNISVFVCKRAMEFEVFVVPTNVPLLLSRSTLQSWKSIVHLDKNMLQIGGEYEPIKLTKSGHQTIDIVKDRPENILTMTEDNLLKFSPNTIAKKLHRYFAHGSLEKIVAMVKSSSHPQKEEIIISLNKLNCEECVKTSKRKAIRKVGLPLGTKFNDCVAMDLKMINDRWVLHMIDCFSRFSVVVPVKNKTGKEILEKMFRFWITVFGRPRSFMTDNGGEFANESFIEMSSKLEIKVHTSPAESPWCNGMVERHNGILGKMIRNTMEEGKVSLEIACSWATSAKNSLANQSGFSPHQLVFGHNPQMPTFVDRESYQEEVCEDQVMEDNLKARRIARQEFMKLENDGRINRVLKHKGHVQDGTTYVAGDKVYYKREGNQSWFGIAQVVGQVDNQIIIKHGGVMIRVHPTRVKMAAVPESGGEDNDKTGNEDCGNDEDTRHKDPNELKMIEVPGPGKDETGNEECGSDEETGHIEKDVASEEMEEGQEESETNGVTGNPENGRSEDSSSVCEEPGCEEDDVSVLDQDASESQTGKGEHVIFRKYPLRNRTAQDLVSIEEDEINTVYFSAGAKDEIKDAKDVEMSSLGEFEAYTEVNEEDATHIISTRWVIARKREWKSEGKTCR